MKRLVLALLLTGVLTGVLTGCARSVVAPVPSVGSCTLSRRLYTHEVPPVLIIASIHYDVCPAGYHDGEFL